MSEFAHDLADARQRRRRRVLTVVATTAVVAVVAGVTAMATVGVRWIDVVIAPADAVATAVVTVTDGIGVARGAGVWVLHEALYDGRVTLEVGAEGFATETLVVTQAANTRRRVDVVLREQLAVFRATTDVTVNAAKTRWFLDGTFVVEGRRFDTELRDGTYRLEARHPYYAPASRTVTARRGATYDVTLSPSPVDGRIRLTSSPSGAVVTRRDVEAGVTPLALALPGGVYEVRLAHDGYEPRVETLRITRAAPVVERHYRLARATTDVTFLLSPDGGVLSVDGRAVAARGRVPVTAGLAHRARYTQPGYAPRETTFTVTQDAERTIELTLTPTFGDVVVESDPDAEITVLTPASSGDGGDDGGTMTSAGGRDGGATAVSGGGVDGGTMTAAAGGSGGGGAASSNGGGVGGVVTGGGAASTGGTVVGRTPMRLTLQTVPQTIRLSRDGYATVTRTVTPERGAEQRVRVTLVTTARARHDAALPRYTNSAGIELKLFRRPGTVVLGTPRGEPGRRANEFVREVRLTRAFYAGMREVTVGQYRRFTHQGQPPVVDGRPVTAVAWEDAARFCNWLSRREGLAPVYQFAGPRHTGSRADADGYRLPTEAEWEWLARKAGRRAQTRFPWGDDTVVPEGGGNLADESAKGAVPVYIPRYRDGFARLTDTGAFAVNASGLHDLAGNASEWTHDPYTLMPPPADRVEVDPLAVGAARRHTVKGSSWRSGELGELRAAYRTGERASKPELGFRLARYVDGGSYDAVR